MRQTALQIAQMSAALPEVEVGGAAAGGGANARNSLISFLPGPCFGWVKFEPWFHSAITAGLRGVSPKRIRVLRASLAAAAAAARAAARH